MKKHELISVIEEIAPPELAMAYDNIGLLVDNGNEDVTKVMLALDCTTVTAAEAVEWGANMMITHHPQMFNAIKHLSPQSPETASIYTLIKNDIALYAAHTNLDVADGGVNDCLATILGLQGTNKPNSDFLGRMGSLPQETDLASFAKQVATKLNTSVRICGDPNKTVKQVALLGGEGGDAVLQAYEIGADVFITGEIKHHQALAATQLGLCVIQAGHYETEHIVLNPLIKRLQERTFDVEYKIASLEASCLIGI